MSARAGRGAALAVLAVLALPSTALAQDPAPTPTPVPTPVPTPPPAPPAATLSIGAVGLVKAGKGTIVIARDGLNVRGRLAPYVPGQVVTLKVTRNGRKHVNRTVAVTDAGDGTGAFAAKIRTRSPGRFAVRASHAATPELGAAAAPALVTTAVRPELSLGARGPLVTVVQQRLSRLKYAVWPTGAFDDRTSRAVMAYRKVNDLGRAFSADEKTVRRVLSGKGAYRVRYPGAGRHVEADLSKQVLALVDGRDVVRVLHTSSGAPATPTVIGNFAVYMKTPGTNNLGMVHSSYFIRGYAIHGYVSVPAFNASHGCLRIPIPDARYVYDWLRIGDRVVVDP